MATQKSKSAVADATFKTPEPSDVAPETPQPSPLEITPHQQEMFSTPPQQLVGYRTLTDDEIRRVNTAKQLFEEAIAYVKILRDSQHDSEVLRQYSIAITHAETASMWAVKAITARA
jgi:hypothetical protein